MTDRKPARRPNWSRDETILALDLYQRRKPPPGKTDREVLALSQLLRSLRPDLSADDPEFRNPSGVYMKLMNLRAVDPDHDGSGLSSARATDREVMGEFGGDPALLALTAARIREAMSVGGIDLEVAERVEADGITEAREGRVLTAVHVRRERNPKLIEAAKKKAYAEHGALRCEACGFDFEAVYGERGAGFIEAHHTVPLAEADVDGRKTKIEDLALVCSNCHRMIHRARPWLTVHALKKIIERKSRNKSQY